MTYHAARTTGVAGGAAGAPLIITCHGTGGTEQQFHGLGSALVPGAHVVSPRGDVSEGGALRYFRRLGDGVFDRADLARAVAKMGTFIRDEVARCGAQRVIGLGYSNGANILAATAAAAPGPLTDLILLHPMIPFDLDPQPALPGVRVLITAGESDPYCPAHMTQRLANWFGAQGAMVSLIWHKGGHEIGANELPAVRDFLA
jgi:phospholipase/carboxylesterase